MPGPNPYDVLKVPRNASTQAIEDAYDRLFDRYEPKAQAGDNSAINMLNALNEARDLLVDPKRRAAFDRSLTQPSPSTGAKRPSPSPQPPPSTSRPPSPARSRPRARYVETKPPRSIASMLPFIIVVAFLLAGLAIAVSYLISRGPTTAAVQDVVVATVNGEPIYQGALDEQVAIDKNSALSDPLFGSFFNDQTITGTRALDTLKFDSLDKLINMQVILQQAKKEGNYPSESQIDGFVEQAKQADLASGQTFEAFLQQHNITAERYRRAVTENVVYTVMANQHLPKEGTAQEKTDAFMKWICDTRQSYDVKILITFIVKDNPSCTSGLPSNIPLPGVDETAVPEPEGTVAPEVTPGAQATPKPSNTP